MSEARLKILMAEDNGDHAELIMRALRRGPTQPEVRRVCDGKEALRALETEDLPGLLLLDLQLPALSGFEVLRQVRERASTSRLPVVILTTSNADCDRTRAYELGANSYLLKTTDPAKFQRMLLDMVQYWGTWNRPAPLEDD